jgi:hypothetical protein
MRTMTTTMSRRVRNTPPMKSPELSNMMFSERYEGWA